MSGWWAASYMILWSLVIVLCVVVVALARQIGTLHLRLGPRGALEIDSEGPPLGEAPEGSDEHDIEGRPVHVGGPGEHQLLLFVSPGCMVCEQVLPSIAAVADVYRMDTIVISDDDDGDTSVIKDKQIGAPVISSPRLAQAYNIPGTPYLVALDGMGVVRAKGTVNNLEQMEGLIDTARKRIEQAENIRQAVQ